MGNFNRHLIRCMQLPRLLVLQQQGGSTRCFSTLISRPYHHNHHGGSPSPSSNYDIQTHNLLSSLSPNNCYLFRHEPAIVSPADEKLMHKEQGEEEVATPYNCPDRLYSLAAAADSIGNNKKNIVDEDHQMLNIIKNHNRLHVDLSNSRCIGSSRGWLLFVNRTTLALHLLNPFHANPPIIPLPAIESFPFILRSVTRNKSPLAPSDSVGGAYSPHGCFNSSTDFLLSNELNPVSSKQMMINEDEKGGLKKFVISSDPLGNGSNCYSDCIIMILCNNNQLAFWRLGKDKVWTPLSCNNHEDPQRRELIYSSKEKLFYAICNNGIEAWDLHTDPSSPKAQFFWENDGFNDSPHKEHYTLDDIYVSDSSSDSHSGKLLMVKRYEDWDRVVGFDVFKLDFEHNEYSHSHRPLDDLGDRALLLDHNQATFVSTSQFPNILKPNSIYSIDEGLGDPIYRMTLFSAGLAFSLSDSSVVAPLFPSITNKTPKNGASWVIPPEAIL